MLLIQKATSENFDVEVMDNTSLDDLLFLGKTSINNLFKDLLREKKRF